MDAAELVEWLARSGVVVMPPGAAKCQAYAVSTVAALLDVKVDWVKDHLDQFPGWWRLPGGGRNGGEIRILATAVEAFQRRQRPLASRQAKDG